MLYFGADRCTYILPKYRLIIVRITVTYGRGTIVGAMLPIASSSDRVGGRLIGRLVGSLVRRLVRRLVGHLRLGQFHD